MEWWTILILALAIPVVLFPAILIWYINISGIYTVIRETQRRRVARRKRARATLLGEHTVTK